jgi:hypothetical protein
MSDAPGPPPRARLRRGPSARSPAPASAGASDPASVLVAMASAPNVAAAAWTIGATPALSSNRRRASFAGRLDGGGVGIGGGGGGGGAPGDMPAVIFEEGGRGGGASLVTLRREEVLRECAVAGGGDGGGTVGVPVVQKRDMRLLDGASANARAALLARRGVALVRLGAVKVRGCVWLSLMTCGPRTGVRVGVSEFLFQLPRFPWPARHFSVYIPCCERTRVYRLSSYRTSATSYSPRAPRRASLRSRSRRSTSASATRR